MFKKQKGGGFIKCFPVKIVTALALSFFIIAISIVFAETDEADNNKNEDSNAVEMIAICHKTGSQKNPYVFFGN